MTSPGLQHDRMNRTANSSGIVSDVKANQEQHNANPWPHYELIRKRRKLVARPESPVHSKQGNLFRAFASEVVSTVACSGPIVSPLVNEASMTTILPACSEFAVDTPQASLEIRMASFSLASVL